MGGGDGQNAQQQAEQQQIDQELQQQQAEEKQKEAQLQQQRINAIRRSTGGQSLFGQSTDNLTQLLGGG